MLLFNTITAITADLYISFKAMFKFKIQDSQKEKKKKLLLCRERSFDPPHTHTNTTILPSHPATTCPLEITKT